MRKATLRLVLLTSFGYFAILFFVGGFFPADFTPPLLFLVGPLIALVLILATDLSARATVPREVKVWNPPSRKLSREVQRLARQIEVGASSSSSYFQDVLISRLREALVEKVSLETGLDRVRVRDLLLNPRLGPGLLKNDQLHRLLYSPPPAKGPARIKALGDAVRLIEAWKP